MRRWTLLLIVCASLLGCGPRVTFFQANPKNNLFSLAKADKPKIGGLPLRSSLGSPVNNKLVKNYLFTTLTQKFPNAIFISSDEIYPLLKDIPNGYLLYNKLLEKYFSCGRFKQNELLCLKETGIKYLISATLNSETESTSKSTSYLFLISMQIWEIETGKMVWDTSISGEVDSTSEEETTELIKFLCNKMLEKLS